MLGGLGARSLVQLVYFVLIARALGSTGYGAFIAVSALISVAAPFSTWGSGNILVKHVARDRSRFPAYWGSAIATTLLSATVLIALVMGVSHVVLPPATSLLLVLLVAVADLLFARFVDLAGQAFQAVERLERTAAMQFLLSLSRLGGAALLFVAPFPKTALAWAALYLLSTAVSALVTLAWVRRDLGWGPLDPRPTLREFREGGAFAVSLSAQTIYNDIDKTMLARLVSADAAGVYAAAYRIVDVAFTPVRSLLYAAYAKFFRSGENGMRGTTEFAVKLLPWGIGYGLLTLLVLYVVAPLLPVLFGPHFAETADVLRWLSPLVLLKALHYFAADTLTGAGHQTLRTVVQIGVALLNVGLNLWLIPAHGWLGAVWSSLLSDALLVVALWSLVLRRTREVGRAAHA